VLNINLTSMFVCCQGAYPHLRARGGKIINIGSMMSIFGASLAAPYGASKGAVVQLTKSLAAAWAANNIQVNAVLPGWIDTDLTKGAREQVAGLHEKVLARTPAGRWGLPMTWPVSPCSWPAAHRTSSLARLFRWMAVTRLRGEERFAEGERNGPVDHFERRTPRAWASGRRRCGRPLDRGVGLAFPVVGSNVPRPFPCTLGVWG
jgi:NAD(P)-dependent dehydrogenase (short-subunit alcohol dehydrogenase family)